ncbi:hypothetical protein [Dactylosporangium darangshiense]|uniref:hypothetical protein n=1 Tax=Dactylosporangium darangshiense TaxID=579108 RepID=UPI00364081F4
MTTIELVRVLQGHTDPDSAYLVNDYPYGYTLRCQIRYWVETAAKGAKRGMQRFVSQTTNPKQPATVWNKPKPATYDLLTVMYLDGDDHVQHTGVGELVRTRRATHGFGCTASTRSSPTSSGTATTAWWRCRVGTRSRGRTSRRASPPSPPTSPTPARNPSSPRGRGPTPTAGHVTSAPSTPPCTSPLARRRNTGA